VDDNPELARRFDVMSIPTLIGVSRTVRPPKRMVGAKGKGQLLQELNEFLLNSLPLIAGATGEAVRDLHRRIGDRWLPTRVEMTRVVSRVATEQAVRAFQRDRGLVPTGTVDVGTWQTLLDGRLPTRRPGALPPAPDAAAVHDVAALQQRLGALGFDAGRVDGILVQRTAAAIAEFQRNCGLTSRDGVFGQRYVWSCCREWEGDPVPSWAVAAVA
jgi:hypothetical protein